MSHWFTQVSYLVHLVAEGELSSHVTLQIDCVIVF